ncbi:MAG: translation initiation factor IF-6 [Methanocellales archaeon]|nr:translation initiation factor IF-6 [Methanocellales archaeon]
MTFNGSPYLGVFATNTETLAIIPPDVSHRTFEETCEALNVKGVKTFICECSVLGALVRGNSHGFVVPQYTLEEEITKIEKYAQVLRLPGKMDAAGNLILANDEVAVVHPDMGKSAIKVIKDALDVEVYKGSIGGLKTVGMVAVATNKGVLVHPHASTSELKFLEDAFSLPVDVGTVNFGSGLIGAALLANSKGYVVGAETTGHELGRIEDALGFI